MCDQEIINNLTLGEVACKRWQITYNVEETVYSGEDKEKVKKGFQIKNLLNM